MREPYGAQASWREEVLQRQAGFWQWVGGDMGRSCLLPANNPHKRLGYRVTLADLGLPFPVHITGLDSAWLCGGDDDATHLALTQGQIESLTPERT